MADENQTDSRQDLLSYDQISRHIADKSLQQRDWSGMPFPVLGLNLVIEPRYRHKHLVNFQWEQFYDEHGTRHIVERPPPSEPSEFRMVNAWWSATCRKTVAIFQNKQGRAHFRVRIEHPLLTTLQTLQASAVWPLEAERKAQTRLAELISPDSFEMYLLTGHFSETSRRSLLTYLFRRGRPTIVYREIEDEATVPLCALCLHPIGYYADTWAGVMCPTDEVMAHLLMMRGSEEKYWANANQHPLDYPSSGL